MEQPRSVTPPYPSTHPPTALSVGPRHFSWTCLHPYIPISVNDIDPSVDNLGGRAGGDGGHDGRLPIGVGEDVEDKLDRYPSPHVRHK